MTKDRRIRIVPEYLIDKRFLILTVIAIVAFSVPFMLLYVAHSETVWFSLGTRQGILSTLSFYFMAVFFLLTSKRSLADRYRRRPFTYVRGMLFVLTEIIVITVLYTVFSSVLLLYDDSVRLAYIITRAFFCISCILSLAYTICILFRTVSYLKGELRRQRQANAQADTTEPPYLPQELIFYGYGGKSTLHIPTKDLLYAESLDNYIRVFFETGDGISSRTLRSTTRDFEKSAGTSMLRCHRSYLVNPSRIMNFNTERDNMFIQLDNPKVGQIPVSRTYREVVQAIVQERPLQDKLSTQAGSGV
ncbi:MAG: LytTR family transcriptional regulator [Bacteroidaceae bacterium]|nr:LytTR family transcriptional regulator [Bacteroidaceae bacterium]